MTPPVRMCSFLPTVTGETRNHVAGPTSDLAVKVADQDDHGVDCLPVG